MLSKKTWEIIGVASVILMIFLSGFYLGRKNTKVITKTVTEYIKGDVIVDSILYPVPYKVIEPIDTLHIIETCIENGMYAEIWPKKVIKEYIEITKKDTVDIMADWAAKRIYHEVLFDSDTLGRCQIDAEVQYNRLRYFGYMFEPYTRTIIQTEYKTKFFSPFVGAGLSVNPWDERRDPLIRVSAGFFIKEKIGFQLGFHHAVSTKNDYVSGDLLLKF